MLNIISIIKVIQAYDKAMQINSKNYRKVVNALIREIEYEQQNVQDTMVIEIKTDNYQKNQHLTLLVI
ncbi:hypothetical protein [Candidatus Trichorickettsia mobilis]|uniref:hypothetical protein n=1 Tax=Candidatus Trichorickettsia mobilis TaxID=1346319 RepID=UPI00292F3A98|nr:hypothetical protein [Candidatus Trichorickettsia mobilis]